MFSIKFLANLLIVVALGTMGLAVYNIYKNNKGGISEFKKYKTISPKSYAIEENVELNAEVSPDKEFELVSEISGVLESVVVKEGDRVSQGQTLATLEHGDLLVALNKAQAAVRKAQAELDKAKAGAREEDLKIANKNIEKSKIDINSKKLSLASKIRIAVDSFNVSLDTIDKYYDTNNKYDPKFNLSNISRLAISDLEEMRSLLQEEKDALDDIRGRIKDSNSVLNTDSDELLSYARSVMTAFSDFKKLTNKLEREIDDAIDKWPSRNHLKLAKNDVQSLQANLETQRSLLEQSQSALKAAIANYEKATVELEKLQNGAREEDIKVLEAALELAQAELAQAQNNLEKANLKAPASGVVYEIYKEQGELVSGKEPVMKIISDAVFVKALVPEKDLSKIKIGSEASVRFDAYKSKRFPGVVSFIYPAKKEISGIVYYEIKISLDKDEVEKFDIKPGMSATAYIITKNKKLNLAIPKSLVKSDKVGSYVYVLDTKAVNPYLPTKRYIKLGESDHEFVEVLSGLSKFDKVLAQDNI